MLDTHWVWVGSSFWSHLARYAKTGDEVLGCNYILWGYTNLCKPEKMLQVVTNCTKQNHAQYKPTVFTSLGTWWKLCACVHMYSYNARTHTHTRIYIYIYAYIITITIIIIKIYIIIIIIIIVIIYTYACQFNLQSYHQFKLDLMWPDLMGTLSGPWHRQDSALCISE